MTPHALKSWIDRDIKYYLTQYDACYGLSHSPIAGGPRLARTGLEAERGQVVQVVDTGGEVGAFGFMQMR